VGLLAPRPTPNLEDQASEYMSPGDRVPQPYPRALGFPLSRLLRHAGVRWCYFSPPPHGAYQGSTKLICGPTDDCKEKTDKSFFSEVQVQFLFICGLFNDAVSSSDHTASNDGMINEERIGKDRYYPENCLKKLRNTMKKLQSDRRSPGRDLNSRTSRIRLF
jgi:hypothetical protein